MNPLQSHKGQGAQHLNETAREQDGAQKTAAQSEGARTHQDPANEGEGSRSAARAYNEATERFVKSGRVEASGERAKEALDGAEKAELERAEAVGKSKMRAEDPAIGKQSGRR